MSAKPSVVNVLANKKVVVIGGTSGIGFAIARGLIEEGASVFIGSSTQSKVDAAIQKLSDSSQQYNADASRVSGATVDLSGSGMEASIRQFFEKAGKVDHVIHTAGDSLATLAIKDVTYEKAVSAGDVRFFGAIFIAKVASEILPKGGSLILTTGGVADHPIADWTVVAGYAAGLQGLTRQLAFDLSPKGIRVNLVSPGAVKTELWSKIPEAAREEFFKGIGSQTLTGKVGEPEQLAQTYLYLLKDGNITAEIIRSDSGSKYGPPPPAK